MIYILAEGISRSFGSLFPLISPWIGLLGAFMTGSNTNSNVVFGVLQQETAQLAGLSVALILAAQTTGGALGSMIAPAKILVGCRRSACQGKRPVLKATLRYGLVITGIYWGYYLFAICYHLKAALMQNFIKRHSAKLKSTALILMLVIPFCLYMAASYGSPLQVKLCLLLMASNMLFVMLKS